MYHSIEIKIKMLAFAEKKEFLCICYGNFLRGSIFVEVGRKGEIWSISHTSNLINLYEINCVFYIIIHHFWVTIMTDYRLNRTSSNHVFLNEHFKSILYNSGLFRTFRTFFFTTGIFVKRFSKQWWESLNCELPGTKRLFFPLIVYLCSNYKIKRSLLIWHSIFTG